MKEDIRQIRRDCQTRGIGFVAFATPIAQELFDNSWNGLIAKYGNGDLYERGKGTRIAEEFFQQEGIPFVSVAEPLRKYPEPSQLYYILNGHFREAGATVVAECLAEYLTTHVFPEKGLIRKDGRQAP